MQVQYTTDSGITITEESRDMAGAIEFLSQAMDVLGDLKCGDCGKQARPSFREAKGYKFYQLRCECGAQFDFGQRKTDGVLFPSRTDRDGNMRGVNGWYHWQRPEQYGESSQETPGSATDQSVPF